MMLRAHKYRNAVTAYSELSAAVLIECSVLPGYEALFQALAEEHLDKLLDLTKIGAFVSRDTPAAAKDSSDAWNVQIFR